MEKSNRSTAWNAEHNDNYLDSIDNYDLWRLFFVSQSAVGRLRDLELSAIGVTPEQSGALFLLATNQGKSTIAEMADAWLRQRNSVSTLIDRMAKQGLVRKIKIPRQKDLEIEITPRGLELLDRIKNTGRVFDMVFGELEEKERRQFAEYLREILVRARRRLDDQKNLA
ncbi:MAG TPA: MarR family transcriptional regulator [Dehalococcoidales bacterium]|nr:MarR family transcriptional regulator [Dehalococcoidales bacterium]